MATGLGLELARRGHEVHFFCYERPFRLPAAAKGVHFHPVRINEYGLFRYPDYLLPLSVKMAEVAREAHLDLFHAHYAVPHATAALLARSMLETTAPPRVVTTLHGTDTTLLGHDPAYRAAIRHALSRSDAVTAVSGFLARETGQVFGIDRTIEVVHNFFQPRPPVRSPGEVRRELGIEPDEPVLLHASNLRPLKRIDILLDALARTRARCHLVVLAGERPDVLQGEILRRGLENRVVVRERVSDIEDYLQIADLAVTTSETESFCLSLLEAMWFDVPSVATRVGGIPEVVEEDVTGLLVEPGDAGAFAHALEELLADPTRRRVMGVAAGVRARARFSAERVVPGYEALYRRLLPGRHGGPAVP